MTLNISQRNQVLRQMSVAFSTSRITLSCRWYDVAKGYKQQLFFGSFSRISGKIIIIKKTRKSQRRWKKISEKNLLDHQSDFSGTVCLSSGLLLLDNEVNLLLYVPEVYVPHLEYFKEGLSMGRPLCTTYPFTPLGYEKSYAKPSVQKLKHFKLYCFYSHDVARPNSTLYTSQPWVMCWRITVQKFGLSCCIWNSLLCFFFSSSKLIITVFSFH